MTKTIEDRMREYDRRQRPQHILLWVSIGLAIITAAAFLI